MLTPIQTENLSFEKSAEILQAVPLGLFYYGFSVEDDQLTSVLCELISKLLKPFTYEQIVSAENKVKKKEKAASATCRAASHDWA